YRTAYEDGKALLKNVSTDGCALEWATNPPEVDEKILLIIELEGEDTVVEIQARVMRVEDKDFAVKFMLIEPAAKTRIRNYFSRKSRGM
ncbi:MAG: PilZ domain-containing protein, partial [Desulfofustis sp.]|nr:PilZ domain-containing protein [Desulfofustis sp.]